MGGGEEKIIFNNSKKERIFAVIIHAANGRVGMTSVAKHRVAYTNFISGFGIPSLWIFSFAFSGS